MKKTYKLINLDCAVCAQKMQDAIAKLEEVQFVQVSFIMQKLTIEAADEVDFETLIKKVKKLIKKVEPDCDIVV